MTVNRLILHVLSGDLWGGAEAMAATLMNESKWHGRYAVHAALFNDGILAEQLRKHAIPVTIIDETNHSSLQILCNLHGLIHRLHPAIVHTHGHKENVLAGFAARLNNVPTIGTVHGWTEFANLGWRIDKRAYRFMNAVVERRLLTRVVAVSADLRSKLITERSLKSVQLIENGVDLQACRRQASLPATLPGPGDSRNVGIVGRLVPVKRHDRFLDMAEHLASISPLTRFYIVGTGPLSESINAEIRRRKLTDVVHCLGFRRDIPAILAALDAIVICSDHEGLPMNALEAAAIGVPIVATPLPSLARIIESGASGIVCNSHSTEDLVSGVLTVFVDQRSAIPLDDNWPFSSVQMAARYSELYTECLRLA